MPPFVGGDFLADDVALREARGALGRRPRAAARPRARSARLAGTEEAQEHGRLADTHPPVLRTHDARGNRVDEVEFHPSWHWLHDPGRRRRPHRRAVDRPPASGAHVRRAAGFVVWSRVEAGHGCPVSMTYAAGSALRHDPQLARPLAPRPREPRPTSPASGPWPARPGRSRAWA